MKRQLSPRELATAIGVSESSLKRWADDGMIAVTRTAGGHRRIARHEALRFIRQTGQQVLRPQVLGFAESQTIPLTSDATQDPAEALYDALLRGSRREALGLVQGWFLAGRALAWIFDGPVTTAMERMGQLWRCESDGVLLEHRATDLCIQAVMQLRLALPAEPHGARTAFGAALAGDPYLLPSLMAATMLQEAGLHAVNLGPQTPLPVLGAAALQHRAKLLWLSVSTEAATESAKAGLRRMAEDLEPIGTNLVVGGRASGVLAPLRQSNITFAGGMAELAAFAKGLLAGAA